MAASVTIKKRFKFGNGFGVVADVAFDSTYPTNGEAVTAQQFGLTALDFVLPSPAAGYIFEFDHVNSKLKAFTPTGSHTHKFTTGSTAAADAASGALAEVAAGTESAVRLMGTAIDTDYEVVLSGTGTKVAGAEVANGTDLSAVTARVIAIGI